MPRLLTIGLIAAARLASQTLEIHSEFLRVNPQGEILPIDAPAKPREILSPAMVRNGFASFHIVVRSSRTMSYFLFVNANPPDLLRTALYKEKFVNRGGHWIPDALEPLRFPNFGAIPDSEAAIPAQTACVYLLDVWVPPETPSGTVRLEVQLKAGNWIVSPIEVRILRARVPAARNYSPQPPPGIEQPADEAAMAPLFAFMDGAALKPQANPAVPRTVRDVIRRNAEQDMALARTLDSKALIPALKEKLAASDGGGEWYLGIRDFIYRLSSGLSK